MGGGSRQIRSLRQSGGSHLRECEPCKPHLSTPTAHLQRPPWKPLRRSQSPRQQTMGGGSRQIRSLRQSGGSYLRECEPCKPHLSTPTAPRSCGPIPARTRRKIRGRILRRVTGYQMLRFRWYRAANRQPMIHLDLALNGWSSRSLRTIKKYESEDLSFITGGVTAACREYSCTCSVRHMKAIEGVECSCSVQCVATRVSAAGCRVRNSSICVKMLFFVSCLRCSHQTCLHACKFQVEPGRHHIERTC